MKDLLISVAEKAGISRMKVTSLIEVAAVAGITEEDIKEFSMAVYKELLNHGAAIDEGFEELLLEELMASGYVKVFVPNHEVARPGPHHHDKEDPREQGFGREPTMVAYTLPDETAMTMRLVSGLMSSTDVRKETIWPVTFKRIETADGNFGLLDAETLRKEGFRWMKKKKYRVPMDLKGEGHLYAFRTLNLPMTLNGAKWTVEEKRLASRTLIGQHVNLDHEYQPADEKTNLVIDAEYEDGWIEGFLFVTDRKINGLYEGGHIIGVSVEYYPRHQDWSNGWSCEGNRFVGIAMVSDKYMMGAPESIVTRVEARPRSELTGEDAQVSKPENTPEEGETQPEQEIDSEAGEPVGELPAKEISDQLTNLTKLVEGMSGKMDSFEERLTELEKVPSPALESIEPRKEIVLGLDEDGALNVGADEVANDESVLVELRKKQAVRNLKLGILR